MQASSSGNYIAKEALKNSFVQQSQLDAITIKATKDLVNDAGINEPSIKQLEQGAFLRYSLIRSSGNGSGNVIQSIAADTVNRYIYTLTTHDYGGFVDRFALDGAIEQNSQGRTDFLYGISGHQGLTIEYLDNKDTLLWSSAPYEVPNSVRYASAFGFVFKASGYPAEYELWKLCDDSYTGGGSSTPAISLDQRYLFVRLFKAGVCKIRAWDMQYIKEKRLSPDSSELETVTNPVSSTYTRTRKLYDISQNYAFEFDIDWFNLDGFSSGTAHQDMVVNGQFIYILAGEQNTNQDTFILKYDFSGNLIEQVKANDFGRDDCIAFDTDYSVNGYAFREPEGMALVPTKEGGVKLLVQLATAYGGTSWRKCYVYEFGGNAPIDARSGLRVNQIIMGDDENPRTSAKLQIRSNDNNGILLERSSNSSGAMSLTFTKSRGAITSKAAVQSGDYIGWLTYEAYVSSGSYRQLGMIRVTATDYSDGLGGRIDILTASASAFRVQLSIRDDTINIQRVPVYADNAAAKSGGLENGDIYRTSTGQLMIVY